MAIYLAWFNKTSPDAAGPLPDFTRAGLGHVHFESIHPLEDGLCRLGRALAEKSLVQKIGQPSLIALAYTIERGRWDHYDQMERHLMTLDVTTKLEWFAEMVLKAQQVTLERVEFSLRRHISTEGIAAG